LKKVLSIDGGGIRGILPARFLHELETKKKKPVNELFDLIAGTSTGGILALCLTRPDSKGKAKYSALDVLNFYEQEGKRIFNKSPWKSAMSLGNLVDSKYPAEGIEEVLDMYFGETMLSEALTNVIIPSYELEQRMPFFFKSRKAKDDKNYNFSMKQIARATSAAPTYFECLKLKASPPVDYFTLIDGGVFANNPSMCAYAEAKKMYGNNEEILLVSVGTGALTRRITYDDSRKWGLVEWARPLLDVVFDGVSQSVEYQLKQLLCQDDNHIYNFRFQTKLDVGNDNMDDASKTNIRILKLKAEEMVNENSAEIERLCKLI
jgi:patatin-like phospholipase/acyl hydrolase